jgi:AcrR family transcriptional regulator
MSTLSESGRQGSKRRAQQKQETVRAIEDAALALFREQGYDATTTKQIAEAAGVAQGTVFLVAPTKEGLLVSVVERELRAIATARMTTAPARGIAAQLKHVVEPLFDFFAADRPLARALLRGMMFPSDPVAKARRDAHVTDFLRYLAGVVERGKQRKEVARGVEVTATASNLFAIYVDSVNAFLNDDEPDREVLGNSFAARLDALLRGVR